MLLSEQQIGWKGERIGNGIIAVYNVIICKEMVAFFSSIYVRRCGDNVKQVRRKFPFGARARAHA